MNDPYPTIIDIEIDRDRLRAYLRTRWFLSWVVPLGWMGAFFGFTPVFRLLDKGQSLVGEVLLQAACGIGLGAGVMFALALILYFTFSHWSAARLARSLEVKIDGSFLQIRQQMYMLSDRKLHFRSLIDYAVNEDFVMRYFGVKTLQMTTAAAPPHSTIIIAGIKDCLKVRDLLSEIDRLRENH